MSRLIEDVRKFMESADCTVDRHNPKQASLYLGLVAEELSEAIEAIGTAPTAARMISALADALKQHDGSQLADMTHEQRTGLFDAALDIAWVAIGLAYSIGADPECGAIEVARSNLSKIGASGKMERDGNGKVIKGRNYSPPNLAPLVS